ncbi:glycosyltransferase family 87 protein [Auritidibacter sp. NML120636]|uniref:glycosyltransferase family 87 protein n=1 Tax=Auritidibacter sp. NML120636 TaxID=2170743 RepID=UPI000D73E695|nr:glycosyltransferase 87 family protein [Auritidibacter sp. NML120636]PXA82102.1 hypothetical protein DCC25_01690 [Auritidibacter sp. NML120636]
MPAPTDSTTRTPERRPVPRSAVTPRLLVVLVLVTLVAAVLALLSKQWCRVNGWGTPDAHIHMCYSDFAQLFPTRGLAEAWFPFYTPLPEDQWLEYPALLAVIAGLTAWMVPGEGATLERTVAYFDINAALITVCWIITVIATAYTARNRPKDALLVALAPAMILTAFINWDLWAVMLGSLALWAFARNQNVLAGVLIGLGTAMKLYPLFFLGAILVLAIRTGKLGVFAKVIFPAAITWLAVNIPFMLTAFDQWSRFYTFSSDREVSFSSMWLALDFTGWSGETFSLISNGLFALCCVGILVLGLRAPVRPRMAQLCLLIVAAFILLGKVYSPQFVTWLIPLVVLARPKQSQFWIWQAAEVYHFGGVWMESARITSGGEFGDWWVTAWYATGIIAHMVTLIWICLSVIGDILRPQRDELRGDGSQNSPLDPGGGDFNAAADRWVLSPARRNGSVDRSQATSPATR